jgi:nicotinamidase-related amidase
VGALTRGAKVFLVEDAIAWVSPDDRAKEIDEMKAKRPPITY